jgi:hypothetical protein
MPTDNARIAFKVAHLIEGQAEGYFAVGVLAGLALATLVCAMIYLLRRKVGYRNDVCHAILAVLCQSGGRVQ